MVEAKKFAELVSLTSEMVSPRPSTDDLDLTRLPARLDDQLLQRVQAIADAPLPDPQPCDEAHFAKCMRVMLAVLPKRGSDDVSGELFVNAYARTLRRWPADAMSFLAEKSIERCKWFPTVSECMETLSEYRRDDEWTQRRAKARQIARNERYARMPKMESSGRRPMTQQEVDNLPPHLIDLGLKCKALIRDRDGKLRPAP